MKYGFYSKEAVLQLRRLHVYTLRTGGTTTVTHVCDNAQGEGVNFADKCFVGEVVDYVQSYEKLSERL